MLGLSFILICSVCGRPWLADGERWRAYLAGDDFELPAELVFYCPSCAAAEFDGT